MTGDSAGGYLAAAAIILVDKLGDGGFGKTQDVYQLKPTYLPAKKSLSEVRAEIKSALKAAVPSYGPFTAKEFAGQLWGLNEAEIVAIMPINHIPNIQDRAVPHYMLRGAMDRLVRHEGMQAYTDALKSAGQRADYIVVDDAGHAFLDWKPDARTKTTFAQYGVPHAAKMNGFFDSIFYPPR